MLQYRLFHLGNMSFSVRLVLSVIYKSVVRASFYLLQAGLAGLS